jgi:hypothetical protein
MWRESSTGYFQDLIVDSPNVKGIKGLKINTNFRLKHLGYISKELVDKKAEIYRTVTVKESTLQEMYLRNERKIKWSDKRNSLKVILLNGFLNCIQISHYFPKILNRISRIINSRLQKPANHEASVGNEAV